MANLPSIWSPLPSPAHATPVQPRFWSDLVHLGPRASGQQVRNNFAIWNEA